MASVTSKFCWTLLLVVLGISLSSGTGTTSPPEEATDATVAEATMEPAPKGPLQCYVCDSVENSTIGEQCLDVFVTNGTEVPLVNCTHDVPPTNDTEEAERGPRCFKSVNTMYDAKMKSEYIIVTRGCEIGTSLKCERDRTPAGFYENCHCDTDGCNGAGALGVATITFFLITLATTMFNSQQ